MTAEEVVQKVQALKSRHALFPDSTGALSLIKEYLKLVHPDVCSLPAASDVTSKLLKFKDEIINGNTILDDAGIITYYDTYCIIKGDEYLLSLSKMNFEILKGLNDPHFSRYLPESMEAISEGVLKIKYGPETAVPLYTLVPLPQEHLNWILSRMLEFNVWMGKNKLCHAGITPESIFIVPKTHGIKVISFYHMGMLTQQLQTVSGRYKHFYPTFVFDNKMASTWIDSELAKRVIIFAAGDNSGIGASLRKSLNDTWLRFVQTFDKAQPFEIFDKYRQLLTKNFKKKFYSLNI